MDQLELNKLSERIRKSIHEINEIENEIRDGIDISIRKRDNLSQLAQKSLKAKMIANDSRVTVMRFVGRRLEDALTAINKAQKRLENG